MNDRTEAKLRAAEALGFREPPKLVTANCRAYTTRILEVREFIAFVFGLVDSSQQLVKTLVETKAIPPTFGKIRYDYSYHRQFVNEMVLSRAVETFDLYLLTTLRDIFLSRPEMLKSEAPLDVGTVLDLGERSAIVTHIAERTLQSLAFKPLSELQKYIQNRTGLDLFPDKATLELVLVASEVRNIIAHNDCRPSDLYRRRVSKVTSTPLPETEESGKIHLTDEWVHRACYAMDAVVFRFDELAAPKFALAVSDWSSAAIKVEG